MCICVFVYCVCVWCLCVCVCCMCVQCLCKLKDNMGSCSAGVVVVVSLATWMLGTEP